MGSAMSLFSAILFAAVVLLIVRVSQLNDKVAELDELASDAITEDHFRELSKRLGDRGKKSELLSDFEQKPRKLER